MLGRQLRQNAVYTGTDAVARQAVAASGFSAWDLESLDVGARTGKRGPGPAGRLPARLPGHPGHARGGLWHPVRVRDLQAGLRGWLSGRAARRLDLLRQPVGVPRSRRPPGRRVLRPHRAGDDDQGGLRARWVPAETVRAEPSHMLVPGYGTETVNILRLWRARAGRESFDLDLFNAGRYAEAVEAQMRSENLTKVLYPSDSTEAGRELRLKQQYFLVSCSLRDIIRRFRFRNSDWETFPGKVVIQLNDTHPVLAIPELMRLLVDENGVGWDQAWSITRRTFAYTCHTLLPEALETWPVPMFGRLLPRHLEIIYALNKSFLEDVRARLPGRRRAHRQDVADPGGPRAPGADGQPGGRRQLRRQRRGRTAIAAAGPDDAARLRGAVAGEVPERNQRRQPAPLPPAGQPAPVRPDHRPAGRPAVADRPGAAARARGLCRRRGVPGAVARGQAAEQAGPGLPCPRRHRHHHRSRVAVRRHGQAAARVQAPAAQAAPRRHRVQPDQGGPGRRRDALHGHLRREGRAELSRRPSASSS